MSNERLTRLKERLGAWAGPIFVLVMLVAALWLLHHELRTHTLQDFLDGIKKIPMFYLVVAVVLTILNYAILVCYDWLGIWYIRHPMRFSRVALASFLGYAVGNNFGLLFGGSTIRYRLYSSWGLTTSDIVRLLFILAITFWIGLFALSGLVFLINPLPIPASWSWLPISDTRPVGWALTIAAFSYLAFCTLRRKPLKFKNVDCSPPPLGLALMQYLVASIDLVVAAGVMYALLSPTVDVSFFHFVTIFLMAQVAVFVTQVPGGIGVLELSIIALLGKSEADVFGALLAYRMIFFLTPMLIGLVMLIAHEITANRSKILPALEIATKWTPDIAPRLLAFLAFSSGVVLCFSAATPTTLDRMEWLSSRLPMPLIDFSYILFGIAGVGLMVVARGLTHRIVSAFWITLTLYVLASIFSILGDFGIEVASLMAVMIVVLVPFRRLFFRDNSSYPDRIALTWLTTICVVLGVSFWLMVFAYKGGDPIRLKWLWESGHDAFAQRSLRALVLASIAFALFVTSRAVWISLRRPKQASKYQIGIARSIVERSPFSQGQITLLGDKRFLMNAEKSALVAYAVQGNSRVVCGDPIGPRDEALQVAWDFFELCKSGDNAPVFYNVSMEWLDIYAEMGLETQKIAQEAIVNLSVFDLKTSHRSEFNAILERAVQDGYEFEVLSGTRVKESLPLLKRISDLWRQDGNKLEHYFSVPYFDMEHVANNPVGVAMQGGEIQGFATIWCSGDQQELSIGLIRFLPDTLQGMPEYLILQIILWGKQHGFKFLNLGTAPTLDEQPESEVPLRAQIGSLVHPHQEHVYTRHGLRNFKERFDPTWYPRYIASPGKGVTKTVLEDIIKLTHRQ
ncbi:MAG TPA: bifunctional lysylphosphatidylglycerol flippase/synthetase MprF [Pirellulaceae bacterium]|nr:bifunctional lysylphosphatidylglycerol flippase/synthetase MprF [Pirellulaceae bacterium]HMO93676.1 bifunctional lysylphosphatidylglycerol flippase/synthetase MprF [Pirellulaceae bacterium]HMP68418.1 bifunctional lysylphosphatidylglycerol flippase/synthetase MprF [Pirellulaceae bacterium]